MGQWVEVQFAEPTSLDRVSLQVGVGGFTGLPIRRVRLDAGDESRAATVDPATGLVEIALDGRPVDRVRLTVTGVAGTEGVVAVREISFPGVEIGRRLVVPEAGTADTTFVLRARPPRRGCIDAGLGVSCGYATDARVGEEESGMVREIAVTEDGSWKLEGAVVARSTNATQRLLEPILENTRVRASSTYREQPNLGAQLAFDGDPLQLLGGFPGRSPPDPAPALAPTTGAHLPAGRGPSWDGQCRPSARS